MEILRVIRKVAYIPGIAIYRKSRNIPLLVLDVSLSDLDVVIAYRVV